MSNNNFHSSNKSGFTLVEMLIIAPIVLLTIGTFITVIVNMTGDVLASRGSNVLAYNIQDALNHIEDDVKLSTSFLPANNISFDSVDNPQGYDDDTVDFANVDATKGDMLILSTLATTGNPLSSGSGVVYLNAQPNDCSTIDLPQVNQNKPMTMNVVYFIKTVDSVSSLWRRTITPVDYLTAGATVAGCGTIPWQQPSCSPGYTSAFCKTEDTKLVDVSSVSDFSVQYYNTASSTVANAAASDTSLLSEDRNSALQSSTTIGASLGITKRIAGRSVSQSGTIRATRLDINATTIAPTIVATTPSAPTGVLATYDSPGQITVSWYPNATSYNLQYDTNSSFSSATTISDITDASQTLSSLGSPIYYFRVSSTNSAGTSPWSSTVNQYTTISNNLTAWWQLNGNANATVGSTNGVVTGATLTTGQNGQANQAYAFSGSAQLITIGSSFSLGTKNITLSCWVYSATASNSGVFIKAGTTTSNGYGIGIGSTSFDNTAPGTKIVMLYEGVRWIVTTTDLGTGWHYVVMVIDSSGVPSAYRDGALVGSYGGAGAIAPIGNITLGGTGGGGRYFNGRIDDVRVYSRALSGTEISSLYSAGAK